MNISYDYYKTFYYVAKYGSISQAAKLLLNNQPNLTRTVKNLESELGCPLFLRTNRGMNLTPEGEKLYKHIRIAFEHIEAGEAELMETKSLQDGAVFVAASEIALRCLLLPVLKKYRALHPGIRVRIGNNSTVQAIAALKSGYVDFAVVTTPTVRSASLIETPVKDINEVAVCSPAFSQLLDKKVTLQDILQYPIISLGPDTKYYEFYNSFFAANGLPFYPDIEAFTADQIMPLVEADLGVGFMPKELVALSGTAKIIDLNVTIPKRSICIIKRKEQPLGVAAKELEKMIKEM